MTVAEALNLDERQAEAEQRLAVLEERRQSLSLDALSSRRGAVGKLDKLEADIAAAQRELTHVRLARGEQERRETAAREAAEAKRKADARDRARELQPVRETAARAVDEAAAAFARACDQFCDVAVRQRREYEAGGGGTTGMGAPVQPFLLQGALAFALREHAPAVRRVLQIDAHPKNVKPLAPRVDAIDSEPDQTTKETG